MSDDMTDKQKYWNLVDAAGILQRVHLSDKDEKRITEAQALVLELLAKYVHAK